MRVLAQFANKIKQILDRTGGSDYQPNRTLVQLRVRLFSRGWVFLSSIGQALDRKGRQRQCGIIFALIGRSGRLLLRDRLLFGDGSS